LWIRGRSRINVNYMNRNRNLLLKIFIERAGIWNIS
jgi:hypothetical protein